MTTATGHEVGKTYKCLYWGETYTVLEEIHYSDWRGDSVKCRWQDGRITIHSTRRDRDPEVITTANKGHQYGIGSLAEPCGRCGIEFSVAHYWPDDCPGREDKAIQKQAFQHFMEVTS